jgi:hypothetical protein
MLVSEIKSKFLVYSDTMSTNWTNTQLNQIFDKAQQAYWSSLSNKWGKDLQNLVDIAPISKTAIVTPASNIILYSSIANYERAGSVIPTYVVNGITYRYPSKIITENNKYSSLSEGTYLYPRHYFIDTGIVLEPSTTPTTVTINYLRSYFEIDFASPSTDIPYTDDNVQAIIQIALQNVGVSQREYEQAGSIIQQEMFNNK